MQFHNRLYHLKGEPRHNDTSGEQYIYLDIHTNPGGYDAYNRTKRDLKHHATPSRQQI